MSGRGMKGMRCMKAAGKKIGIVVLAIAMVLPVFKAVYASVDWFIERQIELEAEPLDVDTSDDGSLLFVLVPGEVILYSLPGGEMSGKIKVSRVFDGITHSKTGNRIFLRSSSSRVVRILQVDLVNQITIEGLPFRGRSDAAVTIAVFDDYQ